MVNWDDLKINLSTYLYIHQDIAYNTVEFHFKVNANSFNEHYIAVVSVYPGYMSNTKTTGYIVDILIDYMKYSDEEIHNGYVMIDKDGNVEIWLFQEDEKQKVKSFNIKEYGT